MGRLRLRAYTLGNGQIRPRLRTALAYTLDPVAEWSSEVASRAAYARRRGSQWDGVGGSVEEGVDRCGIGVTRGLSCEYGSKVVKLG